MNVGHSSCEKDSGMRVQSDLRPRHNYITAKNQANRMLGLISRSVNNKSTGVILNRIWRCLASTLIMRFSFGPLIVDRIYCRFARISEEKIGQNYPRA